MSFSLKVDRKSSSKLSSSSSPPTSSSSSSSPSSASEHEGQMEESDPVASITSGVGHQTRQFETTRDVSFEENSLQHQPSLSSPSSSSSSSLSSSYSLSSAISATHKHQQQQQLATTVGTIKCSTCLKTFNNSSALAKHKLIHSDERKYICQQCSKSFKRQDHLNGHLMTHAEKKPYQCQFENCDKSYCDSRSLRRHYENHHQHQLQHHQLQHQQQQQFQRQKNVSVPPFLSDSVVMTPGLTPRSAGLANDGAKGSVGGTVFTFENVDPRHFGQTEGSHDGGLSNSVPPSPSLSLNPLQMSPISPAITPLLELLNEHKPVACEICHKRFKNLPALNGHMRLHGGYSKKTTAAEKDKSSSAGQQQQNLQQHLQQQNRQHVQQTPSPQQVPATIPISRARSSQRHGGTSPAGGGCGSSTIGFNRSIVGEQSPSLSFKAKDEAPESSSPGRISGSMDVKEVIEMSDDEDVEMVMTKGTQQCFEKVDLMDGVDEEEDEEEGVEIKKELFHTPMEVQETAAVMIDKRVELSEFFLTNHSTSSPLFQTLWNSQILEEQNQHHDVVIDDMKNNKNIKQILIQPNQQPVVGRNMGVCDQVLGSSSRSHLSTEEETWEINCRVPLAPYSITEIGSVVESSSLARQQELASAGLTPEKILEASEPDDGEITDEQIIQLLHDMDNSVAQDASSNNHINSFNNINLQGMQQTNLLSSIDLPSRDPVAQTAIGLQPFVSCPIVSRDDLVSVVLPPNSYQAPSPPKVLLKLTSAAARVPQGTLNQSVKYIPIDILDLEASALSPGNPTTSSASMGGNFFQSTSAKEEPATPSFVFQQKCSLKTNDHQSDESIFNFPVAQQQMPAAQLPNQAFSSQNNNFINQENFNKILSAPYQKRDTVVNHPSTGLIDGRGLQQHSLSAMQLINGSSSAILPHRAYLVGSQDADDHVVAVAQIHAPSSFPASFPGSSDRSDELLKLCDRWQANEEIDAYLNKLKEEEEKLQQSNLLLSQCQQQFSFHDRSNPSSLISDSSRPMTQKVNEASCIQLVRVNSGAFPSLSNVVIQSNNEVKASELYKGCIVAPGTDDAPMVILVSPEDLTKNRFIKPIQLIFSQDGSISSFTTVPCLPLGISDQGGQVLSNAQQFLVDVQESNDRPTKKKIKPQPLTIPYSANNYHSQAGTNAGGGGGIKRPPSPQKAIPSRRLKSSNSPVFTPPLLNPSAQNVFKEFTHFVGQQGCKRQPPQSAPPHNKDFSQYTFENSKDFGIRGFLSEEDGQ